MKTKKMIKIFTLALLTITMLNACKKNEVPQNLHEDAWGDVLTKKMLMMGQPKYVLMIFAGGEGVVEQGSYVEGPDGTVYPLESFWAGPGMLRGSGSVSNQMPPAGTYTFHLKFDDGQEITVTDELEGLDTTVPQISITYNPQNNPQTIDVSWTPSPEADFYCIKLTDLNMADTKPYFKVPQIDKNRTSFTITLDGSNGWLRPVSELQSGTDYYVVISGKKVETGTEPAGNSKDFEVNGCSKTTFTYQ